MRSKVISGVILGVIGLFFLLYPVAGYIYWVIVPPSTSEYNSPRFAGVFGGMLVFTILDVIFLGFAKLQLKHSKMFGALFIFAGLLNVFVWSGMFSISGLFAFLIGVSLILPPRQASY